MNPRNHIEFLWKALNEGKEDVRSQLVFYNESSGDVKEAYRRIIKNKISILARASCDLHREMMESLSHLEELTHLSNIPSVG